MFHIAQEDDIRKGRTTDVYFARTMEVLKAKGIDKRVRAEVIVKSLPGDIPWAVFTGLEELAEVVRGLDVRVRAMQEGTFIRPYEPVLEIEGMYTDFGALETSMLGLICQASGVATKAARCKKAADGRPVISFGARRMHPAIAPMVERNAFVGRVRRGLGYQERRDDRRRAVRHHAPCPHPSHGRHCVCGEGFR